MKNAKLLLFLILVTLGTSCSKIMMVFYGAHQPRIETPESIYKYLEKKSIKTNNVYFLKDSTAFYEYFDAFGKLPRVYIYNNNKYLLDIIEKDTCSGQTDDMIYHLSTNKIYPIDSSRILEQVMANILTSNGYKISTDTINSSDFYVMMYFAKFTGKLNKQNISYWEQQLIMKEDSLNLTIYKICCDPLESWWSEN